MKIKTLAIPLLAVLSCSAVHAEIYNYRCQNEPTPLNGIWTESKAVLDMDLLTGTMNSATVKGKALHGMEFNSQMLENSITPNEAPPIAVFDTDVSGEQEKSTQITVYGATGGVKPADVISISNSDVNVSIADSVKSGGYYWCYREGSLKDKAMHGLTQSHNQRILKGE